VGLNALSYTEIFSWAQLKQNPIQPWEVEAIVDLDDITRERIRTKQPTSHLMPITKPSDTAELLGDRFKIRREPRKKKDG
jgi:hypothetical protein